MTTAEHIQLAINYIHVSLDPEVTEISSRISRHEAVIHLAEAKYQAEMSRLGIEMAA
jgi:hypothetical protein